MASIQVSHRTVTATVLVAALLGGCASGPDPVRALTEETRLTRAALIELSRATEDLRRELADLRSRLAAIRGELEGAARDDASRHREVVAALNALGTRVAGAETRVAEVETRVGSTETQVVKVEARAARIETQVNALATSVATSVRAMETTLGGLADQVARLEALPAPLPDVKVPRPPVAPLTPDELFNRAIEALRNGELGQAILNFEDFLARHPSHSLAGHAQFGIGEAYFTARDYQHAALEYQKAIDRAPKGEKSPDALFKLGLAYRSLKRPDRARQAWAQLLRDFPESDAAQKARSALREGSPGARPDTATPR